MGSVEAFQLFGLGESTPVKLASGSCRSALDSWYGSLPLGVYTAFRTFFHNRFLDLERHLERLQASMTRYGLDYTLDRSAVKRALHQVCTGYAGADMRVRIDVLAKSTTVADFRTETLIGLTPFDAPPAQSYRSGVAVVSTRALSRTDPLTKSASFAEQRKRLVKLYPQAEDYLLVSQDGLLLEGASSNFYGVCDGILRTAGAGVLEGVTRQLVLEMAASQGIPVRLDALHLDELALVSEAAISSSSRGLMPVTAIDGKRIGNGEVGPVTSALRLAYEASLVERVRLAIEG